MSSVLRFPDQPLRPTIGPIPALLAGAHVTPGPSGQLLDVRLILRLADIPIKQRPALARAIESGSMLDVTLTRAALQPAIPRGSP